MFQGTLGEWKGEEVHFDLKPDAKPFHGRPYPVPCIHKEVVRKEVDRLVSIDVLEPVKDS